MQQTSQRELPERISWARAMVFAIGFFFITALLIGQIPSYISLQFHASTLTGLEQGFLALGVICIASFIIIQVIVMLFDPKPLLPPIIFTILGALIAFGGLNLLSWAVITNNQFFPSANVKWNSVLGGTALWFQPDAVDLAMLGFVIMFVGIAMIFYSVLALRELRNPDRSDRGTTIGIRALLIIGAVMLFCFMFFYTFVSDKSLASSLYTACRANSPAGGCPDATTLLLDIDMLFNTFLGVAVFCTLGAFALRLHYLMRPVRKNTMSRLYIVGITVAQIGVVFLLLWFLIYPLVTWIHSWSLVGLGGYLTICSRKSVIPGSCSFTQQTAYIVNAVITTNNFVLLMAAVYFWRKRRNLVIVAGLTVTAILGLATLVTHTSPDQELIALLLCGGALVLATVWTSVARREFAVVGENNLGCVGQWLVVGTCLFIYVAAFGFFSIPGFRETETNIPFVPGGGLSAGIKGGINAVVVFVVVGLIAAIQFYFLVRNRYKV